MYSPGVHTLFHLHQIYCFLGEPQSRLLYLVNLTVCSFHVLLSLFETDSLCIHAIDISLFIDCVFLSR